MLILKSLVNVNIEILLKCQFRNPTIMWGVHQAAYLLISHATRPFSSITSEAVQYPSRRNTRFRHFNSSICSNDFFFFNSAFSAFTSFSI